MSEKIIQLHKVSKVFRLFRSPRHRMMETLGLPVSRSSYTEFWALRDMTLSIGQGERVGLVGRNGAGKSTLLKLIAGLLQPSAGTIKVQGQVQALMELGTGFHPEFTGRQNVLSAFAYQGVTGARAAELLDEVLDFSELEEFIEKPVKTYSAGMYSRLAFAAATAIQPEILIIDEILGAGDAYFAGKSAKRMRELTSAGTTILFVSHDMSAVQMICDRAIWIERGHIVEDGNTIDVGRSYVASIRRQEDLRLRAINLKLSRGDMSEMLTDSETDRVFIVRFVAKNGGPPAAPVRLFEATLSHKGQDIDDVRFGAARDDDREQRLHLLTGVGFMNWGEPQTDEAGRTYRAFTDCRGQYKHAPLSVKVPLGLGGIDEFSLRVVHGGADPSDGVLCQVFDGVEYVTVGKLEAPASKPGALVTQSFSLAPASGEPGQGEDDAAPAPSDFIYGEGSAWIDSVDFLDGQGASHRLFAFDEPLTVRVGWRAKREIPEMTFVVCVYGMDGRCVTQVISPFVAATEKRKAGTIEARFDPLRVGCGDYVVSIGIYEGLTIANAMIDRPLCVQTRQHRLKVVAPLDQKLERGQVIHAVSWNEVNASP